MPIVDTVAGLPGIRRVGVVAHVEGRYLVLPALQAHLQDGRVDADAWDGDPRRALPERLRRQAQALIGAVGGGRLPPRGKLFPRPGRALRQVLLLAPRAIEQRARAADERQHASGEQRRREALSPAGGGRFPLTRLCAAPP